MKRKPTIEARGLGAGFAQLWLEAAAVVSMRMWALCLNTSTPAEQRLMVDEKGPAMMNAAMEAWSAGLGAAMRNPLNPLVAPIAATEAWTRSITRPARANRRRLIRNG